MNAKCVICAGSHESKECPNKIKENFERKCANCGGNHTASYRGCPKLPKTKAQLNRTQPGKSFANALTQKTNPITQKPSDQINANPAKTWSAVANAQPINQLPPNIPTTNDFVEDRNPKNILCNQRY
ncbi:hypothetical protein AVEN_187862-1 [Araneus ventricosus]|uniref:Pre-C2HC domain-containing protein n=1 Tax=Araneus ventricosus TaxID=182803 RepID=A0A4Y2CT58_ARAVE|nr:hypothetical protein AVEN_187862-1 [Araneus ventricosus]